MGIACVFQGCACPWWWNFRYWDVATGILFSVLSSLLLALSHREHNFWLWVYGGAVSHLLLWFLFLISQRISARHSSGCGVGGKTACIITHFPAAQSPVPPGPCNLHPEDHKGAHCRVLTDCWCPTSTSHSDHFVFLSPNCWQMESMATWTPGVGPLVHLSHTLASSPSAANGVSFKDRVGTIPG